MQLVFGGFIILIGSVAALGYIPFQVYTLRRYRGRWRTLAIVPLIVMVPIIAFTVKAYIDQSNLWPIALIFFAPVCTGYLVVLLLIRRRAAARQP